MTAYGRTRPRPAEFPTLPGMVRPEPAPARRPLPGAERRPPPHKPDRLLCLDIETVPDVDIVPADWDPQKFLKPIWHRIVAISFVEARIEINPNTGLERYIVEHCRSGGEPGWDEKQLLRAFWKYFADRRCRVVTWNGRAFDLPVLQIRALMHGIPIPSWFLRGDRWNGYTSRYASDWHSDLMELLSGYGASTRMGLDDVATAIGLPGKAGESGATVAEFVAQGNLKRVRDYCETDCLNTAGVYFRWALLCGKSDEDGHDDSMESLRAYIEAQRANRPHLGTFLDRWKSSTRPVPMMLRRGR